MKNHLFIGLGGQGGRTLGELRKVMMQRARDVAALEAIDVRLAFLAIDSSDDVRNERSTWSLFGQYLDLPSSDWLIFDRPSVGNIGDLAARRDINPWIGDPAIIDAFLGKAEIKGANQRRRFGRLLFAQNAAAVRDAVSGKVGALTNGRYDQCSFHLFATLGGGTGSGGLIDLITLIRSKYPSGGADQFPIFVYVFVTDTDPQGASVGYFFQNQFTGLRDLNALICGRLQPTLLGNDIAPGRFEGAEPVIQVVLTAPLNSANLRMPLETQLRVVAEACFERIVAWRFGQMGTDAQKMLTGEDILTTYPGEPLKRPERSYRFSAFGMRRWEVPTEKLKTLLALDLLVSVLRQMVYNHWQDTSGYVDVLQDSAGTMTRGVVSGLLAEIEDVRRPAPKAEALTQRLRTALAEQATGLARAAAPPTLQDIERAFEEFYVTRFEQGGMDALVSQRQGDQGVRVAEAVSRLETALTRHWLDHNQPLALARVPQVLGELGAQLKRDGALPAADDKSGDRPQRIIEARRLEWDKLTLLSARFSGRRTALINAHATDCSVIHVSDIRRRLAELDRSFINQMAGQLPQVQNRFLAVQQALMGLIDTVQRERDQIDQELRALKKTITANRYEFAPAALDTFLNWLRCHGQHQQTAAALMRADILQAIGDQQPLAAMRDDALPAIEDRLRRLALQLAEQIHTDYAANGHGTRILEDSVLDILQKRHAENPKAFLAEVDSFLSQAAVCARLRSDAEPIEILGAGTEVPSMPRRVLLFGLPQHAFAVKLEEIFFAATPAGKAHRIEVFKHDDPGQIRLLTMDYWLAARRLEVVASLRDRYKSTVGSADTRYFCNIDPDGEQDRRPDLFLLDAETMRLRYEAEIWLGGIPEVGVLKVDEHGVFLIREEDDGVHADRHGTTVATAIANPDRPHMDALHARLTDVLARRERGWLNDLLRKRRAELIQEHGSPTSPEYQRWDSMLTLLKPLAD
ncbi:MULTISPECIES: tubulin-like doman-containing protein [unclassified Thiocapsa]|uniref:tubulin-like doman-containing protein n=1 Tax=unclassified Thiocapsa TaxID=2641286 RepID=UPI0035B11005